MNRILICDSLLKRDETEPFLKRSITGDEIWITNDKNVRKRSWSKGKQAPQTIAKPGLTRNKLTLCVRADNTPEPLAAEGPQGSRRERPLQPANAASPRPMSPRMRDTV
ncbi:hypothetical protein EVAR_90239_1 [Eumeta japonica]|uniref:Histone-lysine N-methyltransferase SETMAR n=1 Tax=Eumeta variegata TaxID=151549 RepID=A0A4C1YRK4_EUMVA|nr:hypothetical protein EVAR_90239_1 [Eumeta japonica]